MFIITSASSEFFRKWDAVISSPSNVHVEGISQLKALLQKNNVDLIVLDMTLPDAKDPDVLRSVTELKKQARFILSGIPFSPTAELAGLAVGAVACCSASLSVAECQKIVNVVMQGGVWLSSSGIPALVSKLRDFSSKGADETGNHAAYNGKGRDDTVLETLTRREREVAELVAEGASNKDIARKLVISDRTVKAHLTAIFDKLDVQDRLQLALRISGNLASRN